jgi:hypothetical protein
MRDPFPQWIPWSAVRQVDRVLGGLAIQVEPEFMSGFAEKPLARINRLANEACGYPGIPISVLGVGAKVDQIIEALNRYFPNRVKTSANDVRT